MAYQFTQEEINSFTESYPNVSTDLNQYLTLAEDMLLAFTLGRVGNESDMKLAILHQANYMATNGATGETMPISWSAGSFSISHGTDANGKSTATMISSMARNILWRNGCLGRGVRLW